MLEKKKKEFLYLQFQELNDLNFVKHIFTTRIGWTKENYKEELSKLFNIDTDKIINVNQVHKTDILHIDSINKVSAKTERREYDGIITHLTDVLLITYHADCVPIYFVDKYKKVVGLAHGGWKGTYGNIAGKMIDSMIEYYNSQIEDILVAIGPSIGPCCYEVGKDVSDLFIGRYENFEDIIVNRNEKIYLDLWKTNYLQLKEKGVPKENIILANMCTSCNVNKLYSYRKEKGTDKRMIAGIALV
ncbi:MAG: peptidoglycan editing factor PgeF [Tissierellia bacterium]|nr:peptidoglycan editing factor PgeF [Tissierellia bacterium]